MEHSQGFHISSLYRLHLTHKALYQNDGYVRFEVDNAVLNISEDKRSVFIEVSLSEGEQYQFGDINFLGQPTFANDELRDLVTFAPNEQYSQAKLDETTAKLKNRYGNDGYYLAQVRPVPRINDETKVVDIDYYIDPARPIYVRRINFSGNLRTEDEVLRREMRAGHQRRSRREHAHHRGHVPHAL